MVFSAFLNAEIFLLIYIFFLFGCFWIKRDGCRLGVLHKHSGCVLGFLYVCKGVDRTFYSSHKLRNGSRYEFLVLFMYPKDTSFYIISSLDLLKPLGYVFCFCLQLSVRADLYTCYINVVWYSWRLHQDGAPHSWFSATCGTQPGTFQGRWFSVLWSELLNGIPGDAFTRHLTPALAYGPGCQIPGW